MLVSTTRSLIVECAGAKCSMSPPPQSTKARVCVSSETPHRTPLRSAEGHRRACTTLPTSGAFPAKNAKSTCPTTKPNTPSEMNQMQLQKQQKNQVQGQSRDNCKAPLCFLSAGLCWWPPLHTARLSRGPGRPPTGREHSLSDHPAFRVPADTTPQKALALTGPSKNF